MKPSHSKLTAACASGIQAQHFSPAACGSIGDVMALVGDKWSLLVIHSLSSRDRRFSELKRDLGGISQKVLTTTLRGLERDGYVVRHVTPSIPPRVDYELTEIGCDALVPVTALANWALSKRPQVEKARQAFDERAAQPDLSGRPVSRRPLSGGPLSDQPVPGQRLLGQPAETTAWGT